MTTTLPFQRDIPVREEADVVVVGGGPAGLAAAVTAAREGCRVVLVEAQGCLGGMATSALVPAFHARFTDGVHVLAGGIGDEIYTGLAAAGGFGPGADINDPRQEWLPVRGEVLKAFYDGLVTAEARITLFLETRLIAVERAADRVQHVICASKSGLLAIRGRTFVDGTGDGDLAAWAGAAFEKGEQGVLQPGTLCSLWSDIDWAAFKASGQHQTERLETAIGAGVFSVPDRHHTGIQRVGASLGGGNIGHAFGLDGTDDQSMTRALIRGRRTVREYERYYREYVAGFERATLAATGAVMGVRETRRILGDYVLGMADYQRRAVFSDEIGRYAYPIDLHPARPDAESMARFKKEYVAMRYARGESYGIPYRCLVPLALENLWVAGRCISCDRAIQGSVRVTSGCFITGQAAGAAAALCARSDVPARSLAAGQLRAVLRARGAYLPSVPGEEAYAHS